MRTSCTSRLHSRFASALFVFVIVSAVAPSSAFGQIKAEARAGATPPWNKGILPISSESYYHAIECGKQGGQDPPCVFYDTGLCSNPDFTLAMYTPYKMVAYEVWAAVRQKKPAPTPSYSAAQRTRVTVGVTPVRGSKNAFKDLVLKRGGKVTAPVSRLMDAGGGKFTYDFPAWAASSSVTLEMVGAARTVTCTIGRSVMAQLR
jgi:hypothetical protein